jgi:hypothetical protein
MFITEGTLIPFLPDFHIRFGSCRGSLGCFFHDGTQASQTPGFNVIPWCPPWTAADRCGHGGIGVGSLELCRERRGRLNFRRIIERALQGLNQRCRLSG